MPGKENGPTADELGSVQDCTFASASAVTRTAYPASDSLVVTEGDRGGHVAVLIEGPADVVAPADTRRQASARAPSR